MELDHQITYLTINGRNGENEGEDMIEFIIPILLLLYFRKSSNYCNGCKI